MATSLHPTAIIHPGAQLGDECEVGPYCVLGEHVRIGRGCRLHAHVVIEGHTTLGDGNEIFPFACLGAQSQDLKWQGGLTRVEIGHRNSFREYVTIHAATQDGGATIVGDDNHLLAYTHIAHDCRLGSHIIMSNLAQVAGHVEIEDYAVLAGMAAVHQFCRVGRMSMIGGCSKVTQDVPPFMLVDGNPAETRFINKVGLERNGISADAIRALGQAHRILFREGLSVPNALTRLETEGPVTAEVEHLLAFFRSSKRGVIK